MPAMLLQDLIADMPGDQPYVIGVADSKIEMADVYPCGCPDTEMIRGHQLPLGFSG
jgi:hypothetical protein